MPLKTNRIKFKVAVCGQYLGYDRSNEGPLACLHCYFECIKIDASLICRPYLQNNHYNRHCTYSGVRPPLHLFVTKPHFSPNRNIGHNYCTMLMLAIKHRHDDHSRLSSSGNLFFDVWHNLSFKKRRPTLLLSRRPTLLLSIGTTGQVSNAVY